MLPKDAQHLKPVKVNIAIVGGGPAGLTLASLLQRYSISFKVFESSTEDAPSRGGSLDLHPDSGQAALKAAGIFEEFLSHARPEGETLRIFDPTGKCLMDESRSGNTGAKRPGEFANRPEIDRSVLRDILLKILPPERVQWNSKLVSVVCPSPDDNPILQFADHTDASFTHVVGADGAWSRVRSVLSSTKPFYSGIGGLDCRLPSVSKAHPDLAEHVGQGMCLNLGSDKGLMCQRNGDGSIQLYAFARLEENWFEEQDINGNSEQARKQVVNALFPEYSELQKRLVLDADKDTVSRMLYMLPVGWEWRHNPRVTLIGDAAHLMTPFAGVGVNVAMRDSLELAEAFKHPMNPIGVPDPHNTTYLGTTLMEYESSMFKRAKSAAEATMMYLGLFFHERGGAAMVEYFDKRRAEEAAQAQQEPHVQT